MNKTKLYWIFQIVGWSTYVLVNSVFANLAVDAGSSNLVKLIPLLTEGLFFILVTHIYRLLIKYWDWLSLSMTALVPRVIFSCLLIGVLIYTLRVEVSFLLGLYHPGLIEFTVVLGSGIVNGLVVFMWSLFYFIYQYFERYNQSLKSEAAFHQMELNNLKSQLNPHFIFNSLNSIRALVDENPGKSKIAINQLSNILRNSLTTDQKRLNKFEEELTAVRAYLSLEIIRYEERLTTYLDIDPESYRCNVPPLMLQTLVENGIKHGISKLKKGGEISIETKVENGKLKIKIRNTGQIQQSNGKQRNKNTGLGIINTKKRLELIYGESAEFRIVNDTDHTVLTQIEIPQIQQI